ncbi:MAG: hypothetical protein WC642_14180 [Nocardioides sp.]|jgi:hypothetical protein
MTKLRIIGAAAAALVLLFPLSATATAAPDDTAARAAGKNWDTIGHIEGSLHQACRVSVDSGAKWRIYNRVDARQAEIPAGAMMKVLRKGVPTGAKWKSGYVTPGNISNVGSVLMPRKPGYQIEASMYSQMGGGGGVVKIASLNRC